MDMTKYSSALNNFKIHLEPDSSTIIPVKVMKFEQMRLRPVSLSSTATDANQELDIAQFEESALFEWSNAVQFNLHTNTEKDLFEMHPVTLECKRHQENNDKEDDPSSVFISTSVTTKNLNNRNYVRFISINAPYTIVNSLPFDMKIYFDIISDPMLHKTSLLHQNPNLVDLLSDEKLEIEEQKEQAIQYHRPIRSFSKQKKSRGGLDIIEENQNEDESQASDEFFFDAPDHWEPPKRYPFIDIGSSEEISMLDTKPDFDLLVSIQPTMYRASNFLNVKSDLSDDNEIVQEEGKQDSKQQEAKEENEQKDKDLITYFKQTCGFRFLKKNTFMFQVTKSDTRDYRSSPVQICWDVTTIHGFYKLHFYAKYWFINSTELPLSVKFNEREYEYPEITLPRSAKNFNFAESEELEEQKTQEPRRSNKIVDLIQNNPSINSMTRLNPWNKYEMIQPKYNGLLDCVDSGFSQLTQKYIDLEKEFYINPDLYDFEASDEDVPDEQVQNQELRQAEPSKKVSHKKDVIVNEKHKFPIVNDSEKNRIRTFSTLEDETTKENIMLKIASSKWKIHEFDISKLQKIPQSINGQGEKDDINCEFSICSNFKYLPYPYSKTILVTFVPKYRIYNRCNSSIFIYQNQ